MVSLPAAVASSQDFTLPNIPELFLPNFLDILLPTLQPDSSSSKSVDADDQPSNPMISALQATANQTLTANGAPTYSSTGSPTLDAFQTINHTKGRDLDILLARAWKEDPELTLRIVWNLRSIHDGKGEKEAFYRAFGWLYANHPRTAISNLHLLVEPVCTHPKKGSLSHGYWKDLLNILALETVDQLVGVQDAPEFLHCPRQAYTYPDRSKKPEGSRESRIAAAQSSNKRAQKAAKEAEIKRATEARKQLDKKLLNPKYRALYVAVVRLFADRLIKDLNILTEVDSLPADADRIAFLKQLSLAGKWAPTPNLSHDRLTNISTAITLLIQKSQVFPFPSVLNDPQATLSERERAAILRSVYQRWVLTPIRQASVIPEVMMSSNRWTEIKYNRVPSLCMQLHKDHFFKHDQGGFEQYLIRVEEGKSKISGATLMPHELIAEAMNAQNKASHNISGKMTALQETRKDLAKTQVRVLEGQWKALVQNLREAGTIENAIAVCDVSGSMGSLWNKLDKKNPQPIYPALALSLILAQLAKPPFSNGFITFSQKPEFVVLDPELSLCDTLHQMSRAAWGMNTDLNAVFLNLILPLAKKHNVKQEDMIKRVFIFSDMQFDAGAGTRASPDQWTTNHDVIERAYTEAGYEVPEIVYWDLAAYGTMPVTAEKKGVALMNGFSPAMLKVFMGEADEEDEWEEVTNSGESKPMKVKEKQFDPVSVMKKAVGRKSFEALVVVD